MSEDWPDKTKSFYAREAIMEHLDDLEDIYLAEKRLEDVKAGRSKPISLEKVLGGAKRRAAGRAYTPKIVGRNNGYINWLKEKVSEKS